MLAPLVISPTSGHTQIYGLYMVFLAVERLPISQAALGGYAEPHGLWSKDVDLDFWKSIDPALPVNFLPEIDEVLLATGPATNYLPTEGTINHSSEHQISIFSPEEELKSLKAHRLPSSSSLSLAENNNAPLWGYREPEHQEGLREKYTKASGLDQYQSPETYIAPRISNLDQCQSLFSAGEGREAGEPWYSESFTGLQHWTSDVLPTMHSASDSSELVLPPSSSMKPSSHESHDPSQENFTSCRSMLAVEGTALGLQGSQIDLLGLSVPHSQVHASSISFHDYQRNVWAAKESRQGSNSRIPDDPPMPHHQVGSVFEHESKRRRLLGQIESRTNEAMISNKPGHHDFRHEAGREIDQSRAIDNVPGSTKALAQTVANNRKNLLNPIEHGYVKSLNSFLGVLESPTVRSKSTQSGVFWVKETDIKKFLSHWEHSKIPYPPPFEMESERRKYVQRCFKDIVSWEVENQELLKGIDDLAETMYEKIKQNVSSHIQIPLSMRMIVNFHGNCFIERIQSASKGALFLVRAIDSMFSEGEGLVGTNGEVVGAWEFFEEFFEDFSYFQKDLEQRYSWLHCSTPDCMHINQTLKSFETHMAKPQDTKNNIHLAWLLTGVWLSERRPNLYKYINQKGGGVNHRLQAIFYKFITYI